jgi:hypothetical protein
VPAPFAGAAGLGFSARYPEQSRFAPLRDVAIWIEGPPAPMRKLVARLEMLAAARRRAHRWTDPVALTDQVIVMAFRDRSGEEADTEPARASLDYVLNLVRPAVFPFLQDCAEVAAWRPSSRRSASAPVTSSRATEATCWSRKRRVVAVRAGGHGVGRMGPGPSTPACSLRQEPSLHCPRNANTRRPYPKS